MKCPHCGIEVRDTTTVCGYCGNKIPQRRGAPPPVTGKVPDTVTRAAHKAPSAKTAADQNSEGGEEEEEGGLSAYLLPGEQVLIGSLSISVKKFFFHAYLTDRRIFLIDTQEKKLRVTAKDVPLDTIAASMVEFSENSDPVLVLSIRSPDDEIKTMKLVFAGNGMDRSGEVDEWVELLNEQTQPRKHKKPSAARQPEPEKVPKKESEDRDEEEEQPREPARAEKPVPVKEDLRPARRPVKDHEKQPPVKRLISLYQASPAEEEEPEPAAGRAKPKPVTEPVKRPSAQQVPYREIPPAREPSGKPVRKVEVQSVMKGAMKGAMPLPQKQAEKPAPRPTPSPVKAPVQPRPEPPAASPAEEDVPVREEGAGDETASPVFCQNCGKKLPAAANFCPGCGTKIAAQREKHVPSAHEKRTRKQDESEGQEQAGQSRPARPTVKKAPKGSEMTILHKFLRR